MLCKKELLEKMEALTFKQIVMMWENRNNMSAQYLSQLEGLRDEMYEVWDQYKELELQQTVLN